MDIEMKWSAELEGKDQKTQNEALDREVERYSRWLDTLADERAKGCLSNPERALIKTYLVQKLTGKLENL